MGGIFYEKRFDMPPGISELVDRTDYDRLVREIRSAGDLPEDLREFLVLAASRWLRFRFDRIAEYYCHAPDRVRALFESQYLVIVDRDGRIENGLKRLDDVLRGLLEE